MILIYIPVSCPLKHLKSRPTKGARGRDEVHSLSVGKPVRMMIVPVRDLLVARLL
jgi:hypothetical protein